MNNNPPSPEEISSDLKTPSSRPEANQRFPLKDKPTRAVVEGPSSHSIECEERQPTPLPEATPSLPAPEKDPSLSNPLLNLPESHREDLFVYLREGSDDEVILEKLQEYGCPRATRRQLDQFFKIHAQERWTKRIDRAAQEADALVNLVRRSPGQFSDAILATLGQEAFRQIAGGKVEAGALAKYTSLFLRAKEQDRAERALELQHKRLLLAQRNATEKALDAFARELPQNPAALEAFQNLKNQLLDQTEHLEEPQ